MDNMDNGVDALKKNGWLIRLFLVMVISCLIPLIVLSGMASHVAENELRKEFSKAERNSLSFVVDKTRSALSSVFAVTANTDAVWEFLRFTEIPSRDVLHWEMIKAPYSKDQLQGMYDYIMLKSHVGEKLTSIVLTAPYIESAVFFDLNKNYYMTDSREFKPVSEFDDVILTSYIYSNGLFPIITPVREVQGNRIVSIIQKNRNYAVAVNMNMEDFGNYIIGSVDGASRYVVFDDRGNLLFNSYGFETSYDIDDELLKNYSVVTISDSLVPMWEFRSFLNLTAAKARLYDIYSAMGILAIILIFISCVVSWMAARRLYRPVREISGLIEDETGTVAGDVFNQVAVYVRNSREERGRMQSDLEMLKPYYDERRLLGLMYGHNTSLDSLDIMGTKGNFVLFAVRMSFLENEDVDQREYILRERLNEISLGFFGGYCQILHDYSGCYYLIIAVSEGEQKKLKSFGVISRTFLSEDIGVDCIVGISDMHNDINALPLAKKEADEALAYSVISGGNLISSVYDSRNATLTRFDHVDHLIKLLMEQLSANSSETALATLKKIHEDLEQISGSLREGKMTELYLHVSSFMIEMLNKVEMNDTDIEKKIEEFYKLVLTGNLMDSSRRIQEIIIEFCDTMRSIDNNKTDTSDVVMNLIADNYTRNLGLSDYADMVGMHPDYLGRTFKLKTGWSFVEYITNVRINKAMELLSNPNEKVKDVSAAVGFSNSNYFIKVFKNFTGMTPKEYQQKKTDNYQIKE